MPYASDAAVEFADTSMEQLSYFAIEASSDLAVERGRYASYDGSLWSRGILPIDSVEILAAHRGGDLEQDRTQRLDWNTLRSKVLRQGMRNSNVMAIAPTATISNIIGVSQSIEPTYRNLFVKANMSGDFTVVNEYLVRELKRRDLWDEVMIADLKYFDGSLRPIERIPDDVKELFATAFEIDGSWLVQGGVPAAEVDRPGAVAEPLRRRAERPQARPAVPAGLAPGLQDHVLPALDVGHPRGEIHPAGDRRPAERGVPGRYACVGHPARHPRRPQVGRSSGEPLPLLGGAVGGCPGLLDRQPGLRSLPVARSPGWRRSSSSAPIIVPILWLV